MKHNCTKIKFDANTRIQKEIFIWKQKSFRDEYNNLRIEGVSTPSLWIIGELNYTFMIQNHIVILDRLCHLLRQCIRETQVRKICRLYSFFLYNAHELM